MDSQLIGLTTLCLCTLLITDVYYLASSQREQAGVIRENHDA
jgi:hypothetical protein